MFRTALFWIVLTLAVAPQPSLLCQFWCQPGDAATSECHHHDQLPSASVESDDSCLVPTLSVSSFLREDSPRAATSTDVAHAVAVPRYQLDLSASSLRPGENAGFAPALERRPLETTLRL